MKAIHNDCPKKILAVVLVCALMLNILPYRNASAQQDAEGTPGYGLSNPTKDSSGVTTWDCIYFGNYWQTDTNGDGKASTDDDKTPIKWRVLSVNGNDAFLMSDRNLSGQTYNNLSDKTNIQWENCTLRSWLNGYDSETNLNGQDFTDNNFIDTAFTPDEQAAIADTTVVMNDNPTVYPDNGNDTVDKIYLLSASEIGSTSYGFEATWNKSKHRETKNTAFIDSSESNGNWWLRTVGMIVNPKSYICYLDNEGRLWRSNEAASPSDLSLYVRPVLHLNLSALDSTSELVWSYAGKLTSNGEEIDAELPNPETPTASPAPEETPGSTEATATPPIETTSPAETNPPIGTTPPTETNPPSEDDGPIAVAKISLSVTTITLQAGEKYQIQADVLPANATDKTLIYQSSDASVASVSETGELEAKKAGTATVIVKSTNGKNAGMLVTVEGTANPPSQTLPPEQTTPPVETTSPLPTTPPSEENPPAQTPPVEVTDVSLPVSSIALQVGDTYPMKANVVPANATDKTLTYQSSDTSVATVSGTGEIQAKKAGTVTITVTSSNGKTAKLQVKVETKTIDVQKIVVSTKKMTMGVGEKVQLEASVSPRNASNKALAYKTSNRKVTVNQLGKITAKNTGTCKITISSSNNKKAVVTVTVKKKPGKIRLNQKNKSLKVGNTFQIKPKLPKGTASCQISYTSKKKSVAAVSQTGKVTAKKKGNTVITVRTYNGKKAAMKIRVK